MRRRLTTKTIENLKPAEKRYERSDGGGPLRIVVQPTGHKAFAVRYRRPNSGKTAKLTLEPPWPALTLASARKAAADALHDLAEGNDPAKTPAEAKIKDAAAKADTVTAVCQEYLGREGHKLRTVDQRESVLRRLVYPAMGERPVASIKRSEIIRLLDKIEDEKGPRMADVALSVLRRIFNWHALRNDDFSSPIIRGMGRTNTKERERSHVLDDAELRAIWTASLADEVFGALVRFLLLSAARRSEAAGMRWDEVDAKGLWTLPASRSKTKSEVARPLSRAAQSILDAQSRICDHPFTLNGVTGAASFSWPKRKLDAASGVTGWRLHDLRRTARSLLSRAGVNPDVAERCLGHAIPGVRGIYDRHRYIDEMRHAFEALAAQLDRIVHPPGGKVVEGALRAEPMTRIRRPTRKRREVTPPTQVVRPPVFVNENMFFTPVVQVTPPTQVVGPRFFVNKNKFFAPLAQQVPTKERMLGGNVTGAELKHVLEANAKALRHGGKPTTLGYGTDWATIQERAAKRLRVKSEQLKAHERDRPAKKDRLRREWNAMAATIRKDEPDLKKRDRAKKIAARLGGSWRVIERYIPK